MAYMYGTATMDQDQDQDKDKDKAWRQIWKQRCSRDVADDGGVTGDHQRQARDNQ